MKLSSLLNLLKNLFLFCGIIFILLCIFLLLNFTAFANNISFSKYLSSLKGNIRKTFYQKNKEDNQFRSRAEKNSELLFDVISVEFPISALSWISNEQLAFIDEAGNVYIKNYSTWSTENILQANKTSLIGNYNKNLIICNFENYEISNPSETATKIEVKNSDDSILSSFETIETITPISCNNDKIYAVNSFYFIQEQFWLINLENNTLEEIPSLPAKNFTEKNNSLTFQDDFSKKLASLNISDSFPEIDILNFEISPDSTKIALITNFSGDILVFDTSIIE